jgi:hypothetical protein
MRLYLLVFLAISFSSAIAQEDQTLIIRFGVGTYRMNTQKQFQRDFRKQSQIPLRVVHNFPAFPSFGASMSFRTSSRTSVGIWAEYTSTGGRLHYKDYSGYALFDQLLTSFQGGPSFQFRISKSETWPIYLTMHGSAVSTAETMTTYLEVGGQSSEESYKLKAINYGVRPGIMLMRKVNDFAFQLAVGYEIQFAGDLKDVTDKNLRFTTSEGDALSAQWDGLRITIGAGFHFQQ